MEVYGARRYDLGPVGPVHHLPAYVALERWAATRRVVVVAPTDPLGPQRLVSSGARAVTIVGGTLDAIEGAEHKPGVPSLPLADASVDLVLCLESYPTLDPADRQDMLAEAHRVLRSGGLFAAWIRHPAGPDDRVDFWELEEELSDVYDRTFMLAQMPWHGFSLAPVLDGDAPADAPELTLDEGLLADVPDATHYVAIAFRGRPSSKLVQRLTTECLLVPVPGAHAQGDGVAALADVDEAEALERDDTKLRLDARDLAELRLQLTRAQEREGQLSTRLGQLEAEVVEADARASALEDDLEHQKQLVHDDAERVAALAQAERDAAQAKAAAEQARERARALEGDLRTRLQSLQTEVTRARERATVLDEGLEQRVAVLRDQSQQSERRIKQLEGELAQARDDTELREQLDGLRARLTEVTAEYEQLRAQQADTATQHEQLREQHADTATQHEQLREQHAEVTTQYEQLEQARAELAAERDGLQATLHELEARHDGLLATQTGLEHERQSLQAELADQVQQRKALQAEHAELIAEREELHEQLRTKATDLTVLTGTVNDLEQSLARMSERADARARELEQQAAAYAELVTRHDALASERDGLTRQVDVVIAEREGSRQLAARVEAELSQLRVRHGEQQERLADRVQEASRLSGELVVLRERLTHQEALLDESRSRAEELTATAAKGHEQGRMLAEVARDRDRLRDELTKRASEIDTLEERLWTAREEVQKERLDGVRMTGELERLREQAERAREAEQTRDRELEQLNAELRRLEVARADAQGLLRSRDEELARLRSDLEALSTESADVSAVRADLQARSRELAERDEQLEQARAREQDAASQARRRERQLSEAGVELERMRRNSEELSGLSASLQSELDVKALESEQLAASVADLQRQVEEFRATRRESEASAEDLQRRFELEAAEQEALRRRLRAREQELEDLVATNESSGVEMYKLRRELEAAAQANEQLEEALRLQPNVEEGPTLLQEQQWPEEAVAEIRRLKGMLAERVRQHAEQLARVGARAGLGDDSVSGRRGRLLELEVTVRAQEQEHLLGLLESAEQKIWEMTDASDRNAARLAASLAQLEKHKEQIDELHDEIEVGRKLLAAAQARALEQERLLASERHKLARAGIGPDGLPPGRTPGANKDVDELFADLEAGRSLVDLGASSGPSPMHEEGAPRVTVVDRSASTGSASGKPSAASSSSSRMVVEAIDDDEQWPEPAAQLEDVPVKPAPTLPSPPRIPAPRVKIVREGVDDE